MSYPFVNYETAASGFGSPPTGQPAYGYMPQQQQQPAQQPAYHTTHGLPIVQTPMDTLQAQYQAGYSPLYASQSPSAQQQLQHQQHQQQQQQRQIQQQQYQQQQQQLQYTLPAASMPNSYSGAQFAWPPPPQTQPQTQPANRQQPQAHHVQQHHQPYQTPRVQLQSSAPASSVARSHNHQSQVQGQVRPQQQIQHPAPATTPALQSTIKLELQQQQLRYQEHQRLQQQQQARQSLPKVEYQTPAFGTTSSQASPPRPRIPQVQVPKSTPRPTDALGRSPGMSSTPVKQSPGGTPAELDFRAVALSLADEYLTAARGMTTHIALGRKKEEMEEYYKLIATALGCIESVLKNFRLPPREEACLTLKYANIMFAETENYTEMETLLSKGITLCHRNRFVDLKYSMSHLLARVLFKTNPRAALKSVEKVIPDVTAYRYSSWVYAFRFLQVSFSLQIGTHHELLSAINNLQALSKIADKKGDSAVLATAATLEALAHLRSGSPDCIEQAQRAIAAARTHQVTWSHEFVPVWALLHCMDLQCSLLQYNPEQAMIKMRAMQQHMDEHSNDPDWRDDGSFYIPLSRYEAATAAATLETGGIFRRLSGGASDQLAFSWTQPHNFYTYTYLLSGIAVQLKQPNDSHGLTYLEEGLKTFDGLFRSSASGNEPFHPSLSWAVDRLKYSYELRWYLRCYTVFALCNHSKWDAAAKVFNSLDPELSNSTSSHQRLVTYLRGVISQGTGDIETALKCYQDLLLALPKHSTGGFSDPETDLCILAALSTLLIIRSPSHPEHAQTASLMAALEPMVKHHPSKSIQSATHLLQAMVNPNDHIIKRKTALQSGLNQARAVNNQLLLAVAMNLTSAIFFRNIVGEQASSCVNTAKGLAARADSALWSAVAHSHLADNLEMQGRTADAEAAREGEAQFVKKLPKGVKRAIGVEEGDEEEEVGEVMKQ
ncbi:hypothetical protein EJ06DRAFT_559312 [Trichodelitschia bisporula]|uniref:Cohesin loading factor-domain-containing protein n=1 Tax=Trichodelitschia bisporula TaxID=703511 RepID=A0A6G1HMW0_9PEZI|nr:hypothetical protein EJ06DRAFT_559312 [Trichodelitschia bisporula]